MREGACPYCERTVLVYEEPPRCPLCACPLDERTVKPFVFPGGRGARRPRVSGCSPLGLSPAPEPEQRHGPPPPHVADQLDRLGTPEIRQETTPSVSHPSSRATSRPMPGSRPDVERRRRAIARRAGRRRSRSSASVTSPRVFTSRTSSASGWRDRASSYRVAQAGLVEQHRVGGVDRMTVVHGDADRVGVGRQRRSRRRRSRRGGRARPAPVPSGPGTARRLRRGRPDAAPLVEGEAEVPGGAPRSRARCRSRCRRPSSGSWRSVSNSSNRGRRVVSTRAFATVSSYSRSALEPQVIPPPTPYSAVPVSASTHHGADRHVEAGRRARALGGRGSPRRRSTRRAASPRGRR